MTEVMLDLLKRTAARLRNELEDEEETDEADAGEHEERSGKTEFREQDREPETDEEVRDPEAENCTAHTHAAHTLREEFGEKQPGYRRKEALLEEEEGNRHAENEVRKECGTVKEVRDETDEAQASHRADLARHDERAAAVTRHHPHAEDRGADGNDTVGNVTDKSSFRGETGFHKDLRAVIHDRRRYDGPRER